MTVIKVDQVVHFASIVNGHGHYTSRCSFLGTNNDDDILENMELEDDN